jgi:hypothetical protein
MSREYVAPKLKVIELRVEERFAVSGGNEDQNLGDLIQAEIDKWLAATPRPPRGSLFQSIRQIIRNFFGW